MQEKYKEEINKIGHRWIIKKNEQSLKLVFGKINKIDKSPARWIKTKKGGHRSTLLQIKSVSLQILQRLKGKWENIINNFMPTNPTVWNKWKSILMTCSAKAHSRRRNIKPEKLEL